MRKFVIAGVLLILVACGFLLSIHGTESYPYTEAQLEDVFLQQVGTSEGMIQTEQFANSKAYIITDENGIGAYAVYVMTPITGNYKQVVYDTYDTSFIQATYHINDGLQKYDITFDFTEEPKMYCGVIKNAVTPKLLTMSFSIVIIVGVTLFSYVKDKEKERFL